MSLANPIPGFVTEQSYSPKTILSGGDGKFIPGGVLVDGTKARDPGNTPTGAIRSGTIFGRITASGLYANSIIGNSTSAAASAATAVTVSAASATEIVRRIGTSGNFYFTGPPSAAGTVTQYLATYSAVNTTSGVITVGALTQAFVTDSFIQPADGSQTPKFILNDEIRTTDAEGNSLSVVPVSQALIGGVVDASQIVNYPADTSLQTWLKDRLNQPASGAGAFNFDDNF